MSTVPTNGMLIGRSTCGAVPVRSTVISDPSTVTATFTFRFLYAGSGWSTKPSR
jgi:hypothetical protein